MSVSVEVPALGESVTEAIIGEWLKSPGDFVAQDEDIVLLETDKIAVSVPSPVAGTVKELKGEIDATVAVGDVIAIIEPGDAPAAGNDAAASNKGDKTTGGKGTSDQSGGAGASTVARPTETSTGKPGETSGATPSGDKLDIARDRAIQGADDLSPAVARLVEEHDLDASQIKATGPGGRLLKGDVLDHIANPPAARSGQSGQSSKGNQVKPAQPAAEQEGEEPVERVKRSKLRQTVAKRLVEAQQTAAMLTTFNEVDMTAIMELRNSYKDAFAKKYGIKLGFMSFFVKAAIEALKEYPAVNAEIDGDHIVYKNFYHVGVAVGGPRGLVVPVIRHADKKSFAGVELEIAALADKVRDNRIGLDDLRGGTFTISNGGIYGSMLSTPILNPPQVGILGMHNIVERPVVVDGQVVIRPIMNLALSYDHRIIDGKEAVSFLVRLKECIETPERILLEI